MERQHFLGKTGPSVDLWALGAMVQECLTRKMPYTGSEGEVALAAVQGEPSIADGLPEPLNSLVRGCLVKDPRGRWAAERVVVALSEQNLDAGLKLSSAASLHQAPKPDLVLDQDMDDFDLETTLQCLPDYAVVQLGPITLRLNKRATINKPVTLRGSGMGQTPVTCETTAIGGVLNVTLVRGGMATWDGD